MAKPSNDEKITLCSPCYRLKPKRSSVDEEEDVPSVATKKGRRAKLLKKSMVAGAAAVDLTCDGQRGPANKSNSPPRLISVWLRHTDERTHVDIPTPASEVNLSTIKAVLFKQLPVEWDLLSGNIFYVDHGKGTKRNGTIYRCTSDSVLRTVFSNLDAGHYTNFEIVVERMVDDRTPMDDTTSRPPVSQTGGSTSTKRKVADADVVDGQDVSQKHQHPYGCYYSDIKVNGEAVHIPLTTAPVKLWVEHLNGKIVASSDGESESDEGDFDGELPEVKILIVYAKKSRQRITRVILLPDWTAEKVFEVAFPGRDKKIPDGKRLVCWLLEVDDWDEYLTHDGVDVERVALKANAAHVLWPLMGRERVAVAAFEFEDEPDFDISTL
ncbi:hypothetical protein HK102_008593 [Quaeritorhiza haematococci]|nr:hypothetical protein HK102_008593 [Quaeritorhiza haematococci]